MEDLIEETLAPHVVVRRAPSTEVELRPADLGSPAVVALGHGSLWARAESGTPGVDIGHGAINVLVRSGTVLLDAVGGAGLVIVLRGTASIMSGGETMLIALAGQAFTFDPTGGFDGPDPVDASELARDPFVSVNLVHDALGEVPTPVPESDGAPTGLTDGSAGVNNRRLGKSLFGRAKR